MVGGGLRCEDVGMTNPGLDWPPGDGSPAHPIPWPSADADLLAIGTEWWLVACTGWPRDRWLGYVSGYQKAASVIVAHVSATGRDQDTLVYPFLMCWRHYIELQLKVLIQLLHQYEREDDELRKTHKIDQLWQIARPLLENSFPNEAGDELDHTERILMQLSSLDPTSEHFRYPVRNDGTATLPALDRVHLRQIHEAMEGVASFLDAADTGIRAMIDARNEYEEEIRDCYGDYSS